ncbi:MAG: response regulator [Bacteroidia bacterium]
MITINYNYVLLAEDDEDDCSLFEEAFSELNLSLELKMVRNGVELFQFLEKPGHQLPQLIFLDINMPLKNGFQCLGEMKQNNRLKQIPVIIYSTTYHNNDVNHAYQNGAYYYVRKPNSFNELKKIIQKVLVNNWAGNLFQPSREKFLVFYEDKYC